MNSAILSDVLAGKSYARKLNCGKGNLYDVALETAVHEILHIYQDSLKLNPADDKQFKKLTGWKDPWFFGSPEQKNQNRSRSPNAHAFANIDETYAVNGGKFLTDPEFACREPALYIHFKLHFDYTPFAEKSCTPNLSIRVFDQMTGQFKMQSLDPKMVYQIHYLKADRGQEAVSLFGHSMIRIITCDPEKRKEPGPECLNDIGHHIVASYRANLSDVIPDTLKGIMGGYPSQLFMIEFPKIIREYNREEMRDLISLPIDLDETKKEQLIYKLLKDYWTYQGKYSFFTGNCATESLDAIQSVLPDTKAQSMWALTPQGVMNELESLKLVEPALAQSGKNGYYFKSNFDNLDGNFKWIKQQAIKYQLAPKEALNSGWLSDADSFFSNTNASQRQTLYRNVLSATEKDSAHPKIKTAARFYSLEDQIQLMNSNRARKRIMGLYYEYIFGGKDALTRHFGQDGDKAAQLAEQLKALQSEMNTPTLGITQGYGIPLEQDGCNPSGNGREATTTASNLEDYTKFMQDMAELLKTHNQDLIQERKEIRHNLTYFGDEILSDEQTVQTGQRSND